MSVVTFIRLRIRDCWTNYPIFSSCLSCSGYSPWFPESWCVQERWNIQCTYIFLKYMTNGFLRLIFGGFFRIVWFCGSYWCWEARLAIQSIYFLKAMTNTFLIYDYGKNNHRCVGHTAWVPKARMMKSSRSERTQSRPKGLKARSRRPP